MNRPVTCRSLSVRLWTMIAALTLGCSAEPPKPAPAPAVTYGTTPLDARPNVFTPWNAETLNNGEFTLEEGFRRLSLDDFEPFFAKPPQAGPATWSSIGDAIVCSGKPKGYLHTTEKFADFTLRLDFRFAPLPEGVDATKFNPNTGVMIHINEPHKQWPKSLEVQGRFTDLATIKENGGAAKFEMADDAAARESARKPVGEWNALEVVSKAGKLTSILNGTKICESQPSDVLEGMIGLQSEDYEVHFRRLRIRTE